MPIIAPWVQDTILFFELLCLTIALVLATRIAWDYAVSRMIGSRFGPKKPSGEKLVLLTALFIAPMANQWVARASTDQFGALRLTMRYAVTTGILALVLAGTTLIAIDQYFAARGQRPPWRPLLAEE